MTPSVRHFVDNQRKSGDISGVLWLNHESGDEPRSRPGDDPTDNSPSLWTNAPVMTEICTVPLDSPRSYSPHDPHHDDDYDLLACDMGGRTPTVEITHPHTNTAPGNAEAGLRVDS